MAAYLFFQVGHAFPKAGYVLGCTSFTAVVVLWMLMLVGKPDGPGGAMGFAIAGAVSFICLAVGVGVISGAAGGIGPILGLCAGLFIITVTYFLFPHAHYYASSAVVLMLCVACGCWTALSKKLRK